MSISINEKSLKYLIQMKEKGYIHASNMLKKYEDGKNISFLEKCINEYKLFVKNFNPNNLNKTVKFWNSYLEFVKDKSPFTAQSKFESTILEEGMYRLFEKYRDNIIHIGNIKAYSNLFFSPLNFQNFKDISSVNINTKDQDFAIYKEVSLKIDNQSNLIKMYVPVVAIECKTYLDKTMLEGSIATADKIKNGNPYCFFAIVTISYDVDYKVDIHQSRINQIYVLAKGKRDKKRKTSNAIEAQVIRKLYEDIEKHLNAKWSDVKNNITEKGIVID